MQSHVVAILLSLFAGTSLAAPRAMSPMPVVDERHMNALNVLHNNKTALGLSNDEMQMFDKFMAGMVKRGYQGKGTKNFNDTLKSTGKALTGREEVALDEQVKKVVGDDILGGNEGGLLGGIIIPGIL